MALIKGRGNKTTELRFVKLLRRHKIRGWRRGSKLPGRPDFVFARERVVVFVDGDFWHGHPIRFRCPKTNSTYWRMKIRGNKRRDREINSLLTGMGWKVVRYWESSLRDGDTIAEELKLLL